MTFKKKIVLAPNVVKKLNSALNWEKGDNEDDRFGENDTYTVTTDFGDGIEMDIKVCGVQYEEDAVCNSAWSEAVLFDKGAEVACTEVCDNILGEWELEYNNDLYVVEVE